MILHQSQQRPSVCTWMAGSLQHDLGPPSTCIFCWDQTIASDASSQIHKWYCHPYEVAEQVVRAGRGANQSGAKENRGTIEFETCRNR